MFNLVPLLVAAALVSIQCASGSLLSDKMGADNNLHPNVVSPTRSRLIRNYVKIFLPPPESVRLLPGQRLEVECQAIGSPRPSITWLKNGEPFIDYEEEANEFQSKHPASIARLTSKLILTSPSDGDVYTCLAEAGLKQQTASTTVYYDDEDEQSSVMLLEKLLVPPTPVITLFYNEVFQTSGTNIVLPCRVTGNTQVYWQDESGNVIYDDSRLRVLPSGDLLIQSLRWSDMGQYTCVAHNTFGKDTSETFLYPVKPSS